MPIEDFSSSQGNKILLDIDRLDRVLCLYIKEVSNYSDSELEVLINRGTLVKIRGQNKAVKIANRMNKPENGVYYAKVSCVGDGNQLFEGVRFKHLKQMLNESYREAQQTLDNINIVSFYLESVKEDLDIE